MPTILKIDTRSKAAKLFIEYVKTLSFVKVEEEDSSYNAETIKAIKETENGNGTVKTKNHKDLMNKLRS